MPVPVAVPADQNKQRVMVGYDPVNDIDRVVKVGPNGEIVAITGSEVETFGPINAAAVAVGASVVGSITVPGIGVLVHIQSITGYIMLTNEPLIVEIFALDPGTVAPSLVEYFKIAEINTSGKLTDKNVFHVKPDIQMFYLSVANVVWYRVTNPAGNSGPADIFSMILFG